MVIELTGKRVFTTLLFIGLYFTLDSFSSLAQNPPKTLTIVYTNNIGAEIDPCPV
jgi:hypothetical protein